MKTFKPMLAPNDQPDLDNIQYPILASYKLDGIRCIFKDGEILSRSLKPIQNKQLREKFEPLRQYTKDNNIILDGEIYSPDLTFQEITRYVMTQDFEDTKSIKKHGKILTIPDHLKFYVFDCVAFEKFQTEFGERSLAVISLVFGFDNIVEVVQNKNLNSKEDIEDYFKISLVHGYEGLILRDHNGKYKCGRGTLKEGLIYKVKPFKTFDAKITGVVQATKVDPNAEKTINELGRSVTSKKKDDRILIEKASGFWVEYEGKPLKVTLSMTDEEKTQIWVDRAKYIGQYIEYKGMLIGAKEVPRHPVMLRFREDKNGN